MSRAAARRRRRIGVVADDLTGAADVAAAFRRAGASAEILLHPARPGSFRADLLVIDTESRHLPPRQAAARVRRAVAALRARGADFLYKKIDSTLRGPVAAEARAFRKAAGGAASIVFAPAFPAMGRVTRRGVQFVGGRPVAKTAFGRDPLAPVRESRIDRLLGSSRDGFTVPDVVAQRDLRRLAGCVARGEGVSSAAVVASAGLAEELGRLWRRSRARKTPASGRRGAVMVIVGSAHPKVARQVRVLRFRLGAGVRILRGFSHQSSPLTMRLNSAKKSLSAPLRGTTVYLLRAPVRRGPAKRILELLTASAAGWARRLAVDRFVVTGGETAVAMARRWGVARWRLAGEAERGAGICAPSVPSRNVRFAALKPGGFGGDDALLKCVRRVQRA